MGWDGPDPHRLRRLPGVLAARHREDRRATASRSGPSTTARSRGSRPELAMEIQRTLGSDIAMCFDECPPGEAERQAVAAAVDRTLRWAERCHAHRSRAPGQLRFGIVQGGVDLGLRRDCADALTAIPFDGYAIGGLSVGEERPVMFDVTEQRAAPAGRPAALLHGHRRPRGDPARDRGRHRHVRLRAADAARPNRLGVHVGGPAEPAKRPLHARSGAARRGLHVLRPAPASRAPTYAIS